MKKHNILAKALSFVVALGIWVYVVSVINPSDSVDIRGIRPTYLGEATIMEKYNLVVLDDLTESVDLHITGRRNDLANLNKNNIEVSVDVSAITAPGEYELEYNIVYPVTGLETTDRYPYFTIKVDVEKIESKRIPVIATVNGEVDEDYIAEPCVVSPETVEVTGRKSDLDMIDHAVVVVDRENISRSIDTMEEISIVDASGNVVDAPTLSVDTTTVNVQMQVLKMRTIPLVVELVYGGGANDSVISKEISPKNITVAGEPDRIDYINSITVGTVDLSSFLGTYENTFDIILPDGFKNVSGETEASVSVKISGLTSKTFTIDNIELTGVPEGFSADVLTKNIEVLLRGSAASLNEIESYHIHAVADISDISTTAGKHEGIPVTIMVDGYDDIGAIYLGEDPYTVSINLKKK